MLKISVLELREMKFLRLFFYLKTMKKSMAQTFSDKIIQKKNRDITTHFLFFGKKRLNIF